MNALIDTIEDFLDNNPRGTFTLEAGRGETYNSGNATLYGHGTYARSSVLAGRSKRVWLEDFDSFEVARAELAKIPAYIPKFKYADSGSTHVPVAAMVAHLPDDSDY